MTKFKKLFAHVRAKKVICNIIGSLILAFGMYNIHSISGITEGGVIGANLLLEHHFGISPSITNFVLTAICYLIGIKTFGRLFIIYSAVATVSFSVFYKLLEQTSRIFPEISEFPLICAVVGAVFVGVGTGLCVINGGAMSGDDALAMCLSKIFGVKIENVYLVSDLSVLILSLTYIPIGKIVYSVITVIISGRIIGAMTRGAVARANDHNKLHIKRS